MLRKLRGRLTYANVMATLAFFFAVGGSAVALSGSNTVFSDDIANDNFNSPTEGQGGLVASDLRAGSVGSSEVANGSLRAEDYGIGSVSGARIQDNNVTTLDLADGAIFGNDIRDFSLNDEDVGQVALANFFVNIGTVAARSCNDHSVAVTGAAGDHLVLTPFFPDTAADLDYSVQQNVSDSVEIHVCNPTDAAIVQDAVRFNLIAIDAH